MQSPEVPSDNYYPTILTRATSKVQILRDSYDMLNSTCTIYNQGVTSFLIKRTKAYNFNPEKHFLSADLEKPHSLYLVTNTIDLIQSIPKFLSDPIRINSNPKKCLILFNLDTQSEFIRMILSSDSIIFIFHFSIFFNTDNRNPNYSEFGFFRIEKDSKCGF